MVQCNLLDPPNVTLASVAVRTGVTFKEVTMVVCWRFDYWLLIAHDGFESCLQCCSSVLVVYVEPEDVQGVVCTHDANKLSLPGQVPGLCSSPVAVCQGS